MELPLTFVVLGLFTVLVIMLAYASARSGHPARGCCAPADPSLDTRMRDAFDQET